MDEPAAPAADPPPANLPPEEKPMEIHKPHAAKTWNEFFIELGTIVLGILIALGLEQAVETMRERELAREAEAAIREEMADNVSRLEYRLSNQNCIQKRLDDISALLAGWAEGKEISAGLNIGVPGDIVFNDQRWQANLNSGRFSRESVDAQASQTRFYTLAHVLEDVERDEMFAWDQLRALEYGSQFLMLAYRPKLIETLVTARFRANAVAQLGAGLMDLAKGQNIRSNKPFEPALPGTTCQPLMADAK